MATKSFWARAAEMVNAEKQSLHELALTSEPSNDTAEPAKRPGVISLIDLKHKDWTRGGHRHEGAVMVGHHAEIEPKKSIRLHGLEKNRVTPQPYDITFVIGSAAVYGSYNLVYTGEIVAIGEKVVKIREDHSSRVHALDIATFSSRNRLFDREEIRRRNASWSD